MKRFDTVERRVLNALKVAPPPPQTDPLLSPQGSILSLNSIVADSLDEYIRVLGAHRKVTGLPRTDEEIIAAAAHEEEHFRAAARLGVEAVRVLTVYRSVAWQGLTRVVHYNSQELVVLTSTSPQLSALVAGRPHDRSASDRKVVFDAGWDMTQVREEAARTGALPPLYEPDLALVEQVGNILADVA